MSCARTACFLALCLFAAAGCREGSPAEVVELLAWERVGPERRLYSLTAAPDGRLFALPMDSGTELVWSGDGGRTWHAVPVVTPPWDYLASAVAVGPEEIFVVVAEARAAGGEHGVLHARDGAAGWEALPHIWEAYAVTALAASRSGHLYIGTEGTGQQGLYRSMDGGITWAPTPAVTTTPADSPFGFWGRILGRTLTAGPGSRVLAQLQTSEAGKSGLYLSTDDGATWMQFDVPAFLPRAFAWGPDGVLFAAAEGVLPRGTGVYRSTDSGRTWQQTSLRVRRNQVHDLVVNAHGHLFVAAGHGGVYRSTDQGETWEPLLSGFPAQDSGTLVPDIQEVLLDADGYLYAVGSGAVYRSTAPVE